MTYMLEDLATAPRMKSSTPDIQVPGMFDGISAATSAMMRNTNANMQRQRQVVSERGNVAEEAARRIGVEALNEWYQQNDAGYDYARPAPESVDDFLSMHGNQFDVDILDMARAAAAQDPTAWDGVDLSDEGIEARVTQDRMRMAAAEQELLSMLSPGQRTVAELAGGMAGIMADARNLPFLMAGGGGSVLSVMGREVALNVAAEAVTMPSQFEVAKELGQPDPNVAQQLAFAAGAGAVFGGVAAAGSRAIQYVKLRNTVRAFDGYSQDVSELMVDVAEMAMRNGTDPFEAVRAVARPKEPPFLLKNPINPNRPPLDVTTREMTPAAHDVAMPTNRVVALADQAIEDASSRTLDDAIAQTEESITSLRETDGTRKRPFLNMLARGHLPTKANPLGGESLQIKPGSPAAEELNARGITEKSYPGLFSKNGRTDLDTLVARDLEESFPGILEATGTPESARFGEGEYGPYLNPEGVYDLIAREMSGDTSWVRTRADVQAAERQLDDLIRQRDDPAYRAQVEAESAASRATTDFDGLVISQRDFDLAEMAGLSVDEWLPERLDAHFEKRGWADILTRTEKDEIYALISKKGGDVDVAAETLLEREAEYVSLPAERAADYERWTPFGEDSAVEGDLRGSAGRLPEDPFAARDGEADAGRSQDYATEATGAGQQALVPGVAPIGVLDRIVAASDAPMRSTAAQRAADDGLFDLNARDQMDWLSDPVSKEAVAVNQTIANDLRTSIERDGDALIDIGDGLGERSMASILDELDAEDEFAAIAELCGRAK